MKTYLEKLQQGLENIFMSKKTFTEEEIIQISSNKYVKSLVLKKSPIPMSLSRFYCGERER